MFILFIRAYKEKKQNVCCGKRESIFH